MNRPHPKFVYFIKPVGADGPVKIGCSGVPARRLEGLAVWSPVPLEVVAVVPGDYALERALHGHFAHLHSHREWFNASAELTAAIAKIAAGVPVQEAVDLSKSSGSIRKPRKGARPVPAYRVGLRSYACRVRWAESKLRVLGEDTAWHAPDDVADIMRRWHGNPFRGVEGKRPTDEQFRRIDQYLADPVTHAVVPSWRRQKAAA